jgi:hypothetical protein
MPLGTDHQAEGGRFLVSLEKECRAEHRTDLLGAVSVRQSKRKVPCQTGEQAGSRISGHHEGGSKILNSYLDLQT